MSDNFEISHERRAAGGRYVVTVEGRESELAYSLSGGSMIITHTYVPPAQRGRHYGQALVRRAVQDAHAQGLLVVPECSFARAEIERLDRETKT